MYNLNWSRRELTPQKLGKFCEYYAKMALASYGMSIYTSEVDDHGIDFIAETKRGFAQFQVKSTRGYNSIFMEEDHFDISDENLYVIIVLLTDGEHPALYVVPATAWQDKGSRLFVYHAYEGKKSKPDYSVNLSKRNMEELEYYGLENMIGFLENGIARRAAY